MMKSILLFVAIALQACGSSPPPTFKFVGSSAAPAAEGSAEVTAGPNGNSRLMVTVRHLAPPERLVPGATAYVVWVTPVADGTPQNVGALRLDSNLTGTLDTVTPLHDFVMTVGVEADPMAQKPTNTPVITSTISRK
ncbi:MAG: hypothetical protein ABI467_16820 [Kofleriaceae bacterium]